MKCLELFLEILKKELFLILFYSSMFDNQLSYSSKNKPFLLILANHLALADKGVFLI